MSDSKSDYYDTVEYVKRVRGGRSVPTDRDIENDPYGWQEKLCPWRSGRVPADEHPGGVDIHIEDAPPPIDWKMVPIDGRGYAIERPDEGYLSEIDGVRKRVVSTVIAEVFPLDQHDAAKRNAKLIANAPKLLRAAKLVLEETKSWNDWFDGLEKVVKEIES